MEQQCQILIVDDDATVGHSLCEYLHWVAGYSCKWVTDGKAALDFMQHNSPGVIVLDVRMPVMDGATFLRALREQKPDCKSSVILVTAYKVPPEMPPVDHALAKPLDIDRLVSIIMRYCRVVN